MIFLLSSTILLSSVLFQQPDSGVLFREDWKEIPAELPLGQCHVNNPDLSVSTYGPGLHGIKKSHHDDRENDPYYVWSGGCPGNWAVTLKHKSRLLDLSKNSTVSWRSKQSGFRQLRLILKLSDGRWLVSEESDGESEDWHIHRFSLSDFGWRELNISRVSEGGKVSDPSLTNVVEVGFTDLMPGGLTSASSRLDWIEVTGRFVD
jgi:hypothetical protein